MYIYIHYIHICVNKHVCVYKYIYMYCTYDLSLYIYTYIYICTYFAIRWFIFNTFVLHFVNQAVSGFAELPPMCRGCVCGATVAVPYACTTK